MVPVSLSLPRVFPGGVSSGDLSLFVFTPEMKGNLCLGTVAKGLKFCTLRRPPIRRRSKSSWTTYTSVRVETARTPTIIFRQAY